MRDDALVIERRKCGGGFVYVGATGKRVREARTLARIRKLAIPPAWTSVRISPASNAHIQAIGRDARGRKQYRYHPGFRAVREEAKFDRLLDVARALPKVRAAVARDLAKPGLSKPKVLAAVVAILDQTLLRVGNEEYARLNQHFGLTTLRKRHARASGDIVSFRFLGKGGKSRSVRVVDRRLANVVRRCIGLPGDELFQYVDGSGAIESIDAADVNAYLREASGEDLTAKDFRTWTGTVVAAVLLRASPHGTRTRAIKEAIRETARLLGNTPTVCRKSYVHPEVLAAFERGETIDVRGNVEILSRARGLRAEERALARALRRWTRHGQGGASRELREKPAPAGLTLALRESA